MKVQVRFATMISVVALVAALSGIGGAYAGTALITGKQIRNGTLTTQDYKKGSVQTSDVKNGAVSSADLQNGGIEGADIGANEVEAPDLNLPDPTQVAEPAPTPGTFTDTFALADPVSTYVKADPESVFEVVWTGSASAGFSPCQFQIRVDGQPPADGGGTLYVSNSTTNGNVGLTALFFGLPAGPHEVAVFARTIQPGSFPCTVGPAEAQLTQNFAYFEQVT